MGGMVLKMNKHWQKVPKRLGIPQHGHQIIGKIWENDGIFMGTFLDKAKDRTSGDERGYTGMI